VYVLLIEIHRTNSHLKFFCLNAIDAHDKVIGIVDPCINFFPNDLRFNLNRRGFLFSSAQVLKSTRYIRIDFTVKKVSLCPALDT
jgi:hypothetical protein